MLTPLRPRSVLSGGASWIALLTAGLALADSAHAGSSNNTPADGETVIVTADDPNPDEDGVGNDPAPSDVTVNIDTAAILGNGNLAGRAAIFLGDNATITSAAGSTITGGIRIEGDDGVFNLGGDVVSTGSGVSGITVDGLDNEIVVGAEGSISADGDGTPSVLMRGNRFNRLEVSGTIDASGADAGAITAEDGGVIIVESGGRVTSHGSNGVAIAASGTGLFGNDVTVRTGGTVESVDGAAVLLTGGAITIGGSVIGGNGIAVEGTRSVNLRSGYDIEGQVIAGSGDSAILIVRQDLNGEIAFNLDLIGDQFIGFERFSGGATGGTFTLSGSATFPGEILLRGSVLFDDATLLGPEIELDGFGGFFRGNVTLGDTEIGGGISPGVNEGEYGVFNFSDLTMVSPNVYIDIGSAEDRDQLFANGAVDIGELDFVLNAVGDIEDSDIPFTTVIIHNDDIDAILGSVDYILEDFPNLNVRADLNGGDGNDLALVFYEVPTADQSVMNGCSPESENSVVAFCRGAVSAQTGENGFGHQSHRGVNLTVESGAVINPLEGGEGIELGEHASVTIEEGALVNQGVLIFAVDAHIDLAGQIFSDEAEGFSTRATGISVIGGSLVTGDDGDTTVMVRPTGSIETAIVGGAGIVVANNRNRETDGRVLITMDGAITTSGEPSTGIISEAGLEDGDVTIASIGGTISTTGDFSPGFSARKVRGGSTDIPEPNAPPIDALRLELTGAISTSGAESDGVRVDMDGNNLSQFITVGDGGEIAVTGAGADAIVLTERSETIRVTTAPSGPPIEDSTPSDTFITLEAGSRLYSQQGLAISDFEGPIEGTGHNLTLTVAGTIDADDNSAVSVQMGNASDTLILENGYSIDGVVDGGTGEDTFVLGGDSEGSFDIGLVDMNGMNGMAGASDRFVNFERFAKRGIGTWTLTGATIDDLANGIAVEEGLLNVATDLSGIAFDVTGGTLGGNGQVGDVVSTGGTIAPGNNIGTLTTGSLSLDAGSTVEVEVADPGNSDLLVVNGTVVFEPGARINIMLIDPNPDDGVDEVFVPSTGDVFVFLVADDISLPAGATLDDIVSFANLPAGVALDIQTTVVNGVTEVALVHTHTHTHTPFVIQSIQLNADGSVELSFDSNPGFTYYLEYSDTLDNFTRSTESLTAETVSSFFTDNGQPLTDSPPAEADRRFYRIVEEQ